jgi:hypothetical protein
MLEVDDVGMVVITYVIDGDPPLQLKAMAKLETPTAIPSLQIYDEGEVKDANGDPLLLLTAELKLNMTMAILLLQLDGEGEVRDTNGDPLAPNLWRMRC